MGKYSKKYNKKTKNIRINNSVNLAIFLITFVVISVTIGYSSFFASLQVDNVTAYLMVQTDIRVTNFRQDSVLNGAISSYEKYGVSNVMSTINLPNSNSAVTYNVEILNIGNAEMGIANITGLPSNLTYEFSDYVLGRILCDDDDSTQCTLGSTTTVPLTIKYVDGGYDSNNTTFHLNLQLTFEEVQYVAKIGSNYYTTLASAVTSVSKNNTLTEVVLLKNTSERITVVAKQNIAFDMSGLKISNNGNAPVIENNGTIIISNGVIYSSATQGAINVNAGGSFMMSGGSIITAGSRQAIYNNGGMVNISGSAYIKSSTNLRAAVHNHLSGGSIVITGGTIISEKFSAVLNEAGTLIIGVSGGNVNTNSPFIMGEIYGVNNSTGGNTPTVTNFDYYDGLIAGKTRAIYDEGHILNKEPGYGIAHSVEYVNSGRYDAAHLGIIAIVTFNPGDGNVSEVSRNVEKGNQIGFLPVPTFENHFFEGWFTAASGGTKVESSTIINDDIELFAHWIHIDDIYVARIGETQYHTLAEAVNAVNNNTETTIVLIKDTAENITIPTNKNIIFDLQTYTLSSPNDASVITNNGKCKITSGTITTNSIDHSAVDNEAKGTFTITGGSIVAMGLRQAIYNNGGKVTISGSAYLEANTDVRATVQNHAAGGSVTITGGSIVSVYFSAIYNEAGSLLFGINDGSIDITTPIAIGKDYGVLNSSNFEFYDGTIKGLTDAISGNVSAIDANSSISTAVEVIDNKTYHIAYLN